MFPRSCTPKNEVIAGTFNNNVPDEESDDHFQSVRTADRLTRREFVWDLDESTM
jgi:hypothetical protein